MPSHKPNRNFGQNFLTTHHYVEKIAASLPIEQGDEIWEIGPGTGALSTELLSYDAPLTMIELDKTIIPHLESTIHGRPCTIIQGDAAAYDYSTITTPFHLVGNLPYNVASHIIKQALLTGTHLRSLTCMVQREVAQRICHKGGGKNRSFLTILCGYFGEPRQLFTVPPGAFFPPPKVTSAVFQIHLTPDTSGPLAPEELPLFFNFVSRGFSMRRKKLLTPLSTHIKSKEEVREALRTCQINENVRAEELEVPQWLELYQTLYS
ncbi:16S rRNA (adenine(1518)-N(6)/adenine(1519)-N(6))-dimethyltransferase RsmA [Chitinivibrio alkaliphilus]|uniref:Ribosomal RNA small subunit methyltransferase A n=1 Tax=Chitinivibrio alkaliphilus ACht1 TaxID=1313304 RepID=U7D921_9BACT|nr:16S rRNA (adenine(1518)-N(6)/adenine(1519)-N(6))-dimethyltransferase RsmA [Chitinivibrio alkaliphilus]ERP31597.1 dimethyladenosine transferase [Chitinivibrio alkaliphilus ACht1]